MKFANNRVATINLGGLLSEGQARDALLAAERCVRYKDALCVPLASGEVWLFDYDILVCWGTEQDELQALLHRLGVESGRLEGADFESFRFEMGASDNRIARDVIGLSDDDPLRRLAVSHALAQSAKLVEYEQRAQQTITTYGDIPVTLAEHGRITLSRRDIAKIRGRLFSTKSDIILHYGLLDTPEFFWQYPEYEQQYATAARYLEVHPRVELLSKKLETIDALFDMLADEQKHQHSAFLEWIIIILIAFEIVIFLGQEMARLLN